jgi:hypothetical protein
MAAGSFRRERQPWTHGRTSETYDSVASSWQAAGEQLGTLGVEQDAGEQANP